MSSFKRDLLKDLHPSVEGESRRRFESVEIDNNPVVPPKSSVDDEFDFGADFHKWIVRTDDSKAEGSAIQDSSNRFTSATMPLKQSLEIVQVVSKVGSGVFQPLLSQSATACNVAAATAPPGREERSPFLGMAARFENGVPCCVREAVTELDLEKYFDPINPQKVNMKIELGPNDWRHGSSPNENQFQQKQEEFKIPTIDGIGRDSSESDQTWEEEYQASDMNSGDRALPGDSFYNTSPVYCSTPDVEQLVNKTNGSWEESDSFDVESPNLKKLRRNKTSQASHNQTVKQSGKGNKTAKKMSKREISAICNSYVSQNYYNPSSSKAVILPLPREFPKTLRPWLDDRIAKQQQADEGKGFNGPHVLLYDPLEDLSPEQEGHEAARCRRAAKLIFDKGILGTFDEPYSYSMAGVYHYIPKWETDKWNDDSNFVITDKEFEDLIDHAYNGTENKAQLSQNTVQNYLSTEMENEFYGPKLDDIDQSVKNTKRCRQDAAHDDIRPYQIATQSVAAAEMDKTREQTLNNIVRESEFPASTRKELQNSYFQTSTSDRPRNDLRLESTSPQILLRDWPVSATKSLESFKTACESPRIIDLTSDNRPMPIPSFHTERPSNLNYTGSSKGQNSRHSSQRKSTKSVFALVGDRRELQDGRVLEISPSSKSNLGRSPPRLRPLRPSAEAYSIRASQKDRDETIRSPCTPTQTGGRRGTLSTSVTPTPTLQISSNFLSRPSTPKPKPMVGKFYPGHNPLTQTSYVSTSARYHSNALDANHVPQGFTQAGNDKPMGKNPPSDSHMQNDMYYPIKPHGAHRTRYHDAYAGNTGLHDSRRSPRTWSSDRTISMTSQRNGSLGFPMLDYQPETPCRNEKKRKHMVTDFGQSTSPISPCEPPAKRSIYNPSSDPRTPRIYDSSPIKFTLPSPSFKPKSREKAVITFQGHNECAKAQKALEDSASAAPEKKILFLETFEVKPTTIVLSGIAGNNIRGWVKTLLPNARVEISMT